MIPKDIADYGVIFAVILVLEHMEDKSHKHGSATMLYIMLGVLALVLSYVLAQAVHHAQPDARPHGTMHQENL